MRLGNGRNQYTWVDDWAGVPDTESGRPNGRTHGVVVTEAGAVIVFRQADPAVLVFSPDGDLQAAWGDRFPGAHGMTLVKEGATEYLWLTDESTAEVVKTTLDGQTVQRLSPPETESYRNGTYSPTWVAVHEERYGGNGDVWVADGYGMSYVHRYDKTGRYLYSISGEEGRAGRFDCPHGLWVDVRRGEPELYIADRGNRRFQVYDMEGRFKRVFGTESLACPCGCVSWKDQLLVPELCARLAVLDAEDRLVCYLGRNEAACDMPGWPNLPAEQIRPGKFNSPHALAVDDAGNLYVVEWIVGGRITKLARWHE